MKHFILNFGIHFLSINIIWCDSESLKTRSSRGLDPDLVAGVSEQGVKFLNELKDLFNNPSKVSKQCKYKCPEGKTFSPNSTKKCELNDCMFNSEFE